MCLNSGGIVVAVKLFSDVTYLERLQIPVLTARSIISNRYKKGQNLSHCHFLKSYISIMSMYNSAGLPAQDMSAQYPQQAIMSMYNSAGLQAQDMSAQYPQQVVYAHQPDQQAILGPGQTIYNQAVPTQVQTGMVPYDNSPDKYRPRRHGLRNRPVAPPPYRKEKSTVRKVVEGVAIGVAGTLVLSEIEKHRHKTRSSGSTSQLQQSSTTGAGDSPGMNEIIDGALAVGGVALALYEKNKKRRRSGSESSHEDGDPRFTTLIEGALATAGAVALAYHEKDKKSKRTGHRRR